MIYLIALTCFMVGVFAGSVVTCKLESEQDQIRERLAEVRRSRRHVYYQDSHFN